jgi:hypothetical protein
MFSELHSRYPRGSSTHAWVLLVCMMLLAVPSTGTAQENQSSATLTSAPAGTTNETNPEIQVVSPGKVSYRYRVNGGPYSRETPLAKSIKFDGDVNIGQRRFVAGTRELVDFLALRNTDWAFTDVIDTFEVERLESQLHVAYTVNKIRTTIEPDNIVNISGSGVGDLKVTMQEKVSAGLQFELSALALTGGQLSKTSSAGDTRRFRLSVPRANQTVTLTAMANNSETRISVDGQVTGSGNTVLISIPTEGSSVEVLAGRPGGSLHAYVIDIQYDDALPVTEYRSYFVRAFTPESDYVSVDNAGTSSVTFQLTFNRKFGLGQDGLIDEIRAMPEEYPSESTARKVWRFIRDNRYHFWPLSPAHWNHSPTLFFNSIGFGLCDDSASVFSHLVTAMGYTGRVWELNGHVVPEVLIDGRWEMWDPDLELYYVNRQGMVAGVEELAGDPDLITHPLSPMSGATGYYAPAIAAIYSSRDDNRVSGEYSTAPVVSASPMTLMIPPGGAFEFPDVYDAPLSALDLSRVPSSLYSNARLIVPAGFSGTVRMPLVIQSIGWSNDPTLDVITKDAQGNWDAQPTRVTWHVDAESPFTTATRSSGPLEDWVTLTSSEDATIHYTTDGSTPTLASPSYSAPLNTVPGGIVRFFGVDTVGNEEQVRYSGPSVASVQLQISARSTAALTLSATASGGGASYEYMFLLVDVQGKPTIAQYFGPSSTWTWDKSSVPTGWYVVQVRVRNLGTTAPGERSAQVGPIYSGEIAPVLSNPGDQVNDDTRRSYFEAVLSDRPVAYWRLDGAAGESAADSIGANAGTLFGGVAFAQPGALSDGTGAMRFNGATGHLRVPDDQALRLAGDLTLELWVNVSLAARQTLISKTYSHEFELTLETNGALNLYQGNGVAFSNVLSPAAAITANTWHHVVVTRTTATQMISFYVDGVLRGSGVSSVLPSPGSNWLSIGRSESDLQYANGTLDEVAIYATVLSPAQIAMHWTMRLADGIGIPVELPLVASDLDGDGLSYGANGLPPGLSINAATGLISGTVTSASAGTYRVSATASDGRLSDTQSFTWTITHVNRAPTLASLSDQTTPAAESVGAQVAAIDADGDALVYGAVGLPASLVLNPATGRISGVVAATTGVYLVTVTVSDGAAWRSQTFRWTVTAPNHAPVLVNPGPQTNPDRWDYGQAVGADTPVAYWRLDDAAGTGVADSIGTNAGSIFGGVTRAEPGALADGAAAMFFNGATGRIAVANSASLQLAGDLTLELWLKVSLATRQTLISKTYSREFELTLETNGALNLYQGNSAGFSNVVSAPRAVTANTWHHVVVTRTAATQMIRFYVDGLARGTGVSARIPAAGSNWISIGRSESGSQYVNGYLDEVAVYRRALSPVQVARHWAMRVADGAATPVELPMAASDADGDRLTYGASGLPPGLSINAASGLISGTLTAASAGTYQVTATATDGRVVDAQSFEWTIMHVNRAPTLAAPGDQATPASESVALQLTATDMDGDALVYSAVGLPESLVLDSATGRICGTLVTAAGVYPVTVTVFDGAASSSQTFRWTITAPNHAPVLVSPGPQTNPERWDYAEGVAADTPIAYWRLEASGGTTVADRIGANSGTMFGGVTPAQPGALADGTTAMLFNGVTGRIAVANGAALQLAGDLTLELWLNVSLATRQTLISKTYSREFELTLETNGALNLYQGNGVSFSNVVSAPGAVTASMWHHVVVTRAAATQMIRFYVDGVARGSGVSSTIPTAGSNWLSIGRSESGRQYVSGRLEEVALYAAVLSPAQVARHWGLRVADGAATRLELALVASDPDGDGLTYSASGLPPGLSINAASGLISGTLTAASAGTYNVITTVSDGRLVDTQSFTWLITR